MAQAEADLRRREAVLICLLTGHVAALIIRIYLISARHHAHSETQGVA